MATEAIRGDFNKTLLCLQLSTIIVTTADTH